MKKVYTCYACGFPMAFEETEVPASCPGCGAPRSQFLEEPWLGSIDKRRIPRRRIRIAIRLIFLSIPPKILYLKRETGEFADG